MGTLASQASAEEAMPGVLGEVRDRRKWLWRNCHRSNERPFAAFCRKKTEEETACGAEAYVRYDGRTAQVFCISVLVPGCFTLIVSRTASGSRSVSY